MYWKLALGVQCKCRENFGGSFCQYAKAISQSIKNSAAEFRHFDEDTLAAISGVGSASAASQHGFNQRTNSIVIAMGDAAKFVFCLTNPCENGGSCFITNTATTKVIYWKSS